MTTETRLPHYDDIEVDKVPGAWVLTWRLPDDNTSLRLKIRHNFSQEPDDFVAEVRYRPDELMFFNDEIEAECLVIEINSQNDDRKRMRETWLVRRSKASTGLVEEDCGVN